MSVSVSLFPSENVFLFCLFVVQYFHWFFALSVIEIVFLFFFSVLCPSGDRALVLFLSNAVGFAFELFWV